MNRFRVKDRAPDRVSLKFKKQLACLCVCVAALLFAPNASATTLTTYELQGSLGLLFSRTDKDPNVFRYNFGIGENLAPVNFQFIYNHEAHSGKLVANLVGGVYQGDDYNKKLTNDVVSMHLELNYIGLSPGTDLILGRNYATNPPEFIADGTGYVELRSTHLYGKDVPVRIDLVDRYVTGEALNSAQLARAGGDPFNVGLDLLKNSIFGFRTWFSTASGQYAFSSSNYYNFSGDAYGRIIGSRTEVLPRAPVPEPTTLSLFAVGILGARLRRRSSATRP